MTLKEEDTVKHSADIAIIGGSGLYQMADLTNQRSVSISTPYGKPSDDIILGELIDRSIKPRDFLHFIVK